MTGSSPVAAELFCGAGGLSLGLERAGFDVVLGIDSDGRATKTFAENHDGEVLASDITTLEVESIDIHLESIDLIAGGPPCPTFSKVGRTKIGSIEARNPDTDSRHQLYEHFLRFVREIEPPVFLMENVPGMRSALNERNHSVLEVIRREMMELGYEVSVQFPEAADYGVPQRRTRAIFVGNRLGRSNPDLGLRATHRKPRTDDERTVKFSGDHPGFGADQTTLDSFGVAPEPDSSAVRTFPRYERGLPGKAPWNTVGEAILDLPPLSPDGGTPPTEATEYLLEPFTEYQRWARENVPMDSLANHHARGQNMDDLSLYKLLGEGVGWIIGDIESRFQPYRDDIFADNFRKQRATRPASTVLAHISKDGHQYIHPREARSLTVREAARLQSFPDGFVFPVSRTQAYRQVGNAVPPLLAQAAGTAILDELL